MATAVVMPRQGNTVESVLIARWLKQPGDKVAQGEVLLEVETDKALLEVESPAAGVLLAAFYDTGAEVPVMTNVGVIGEPGEDVEPFKHGIGTINPDQSAPAAPESPAETSQATAQPTVSASGSSEGFVMASPRARNLAREKGLRIDSLQGSGPEGRIIERDVQAALSQRPAMTPAARAAVAESDLTAPDNGSGPGGRVTLRDLSAPQAANVSTEPESDDVRVIPVKGVRRVTAERMRASLQETAQLTLNSSADARALTAYRKRLKASDESLGLRDITLNDLILYAVSRVLPQHPDLNALFTGDAIHQHSRVHLGFAVDTPRGLIVPVIRDADRRSLKGLAAESRRLVDAVQNGRVSPDDLKGGTFTVSNLGSFGIESFTPILNPPQVAILGVGGIQLKAVLVNDEVQHIPHLGLSLTVDHQAVDGAPGARFLQGLAAALANIDLMLAV